MAKKESKGRDRTTVYLDPNQKEQLKKLSEKTHILPAELVRMSIDMLLRKHKMEVKK